MPLSGVERKILDYITIASDSDPLNPEFPPNAPAFPATPTYEIQVDGFSYVFLKDESKNPTGTHKDRMAWEVVVFYKQFLLEKLRKNHNIQLPRVSIISSGSAALAIQNLFNQYMLPPLKVLVDPKLNGAQIEMLEKIGCELFFTNLAEKSLSTENILELTNNMNGYDITSNQAFDPETYFYDWLGYEIINNNPDYCFIPYGSGHLYKNILNIVKKERSLQQSDSRFTGEIDIISNCDYMAATVSHASSKAFKLYSPHSPFNQFNEQWISFYRQAGYCGMNSNVYELKENFLEDAILLAEKQQIVAEPSGITGLALLLQMRKTINPDKKILIVNTGRAQLPV